MKQEPIKEKDISELVITKFDCTKTTVRATKLNINVHCLSYPSRV